MDVGYKGKRVTTRFLAWVTGQTGSSLPDTEKMGRNRPCVREADMAKPIRCPQGDVMLAVGWMYESSIWRSWFGECTFGMVLKAFGCEEITTKGLSREEDIEVNLSPPKRLPLTCFLLLESLGTC